MRMTSPDNIVTEENAWAATQGDLFDLPQLTTLGLAVTRGHVGPVEITQRVDAVFGPGQWGLYAEPTHEWWLPARHTQECWDELYEGRRIDPGHEPCGITSGGCDSRAYVEISEPHIVWRPARRGDTGAVPVTVLEINLDPEPDQVIPSQLEITA